VHYATSKPFEGANTQVFLSLEPVFIFHLSLYDIFSLMKCSKLCRKIRNMLHIDHAHFLLHSSQLFTCSLLPSIVQQYQYKFKWHWSTFNSLKCVHLAYATPMGHRAAAIQNTGRTNIL
jgi:hypothetical protein